MGFGDPLVRDLHGDEGLVGLDGQVLLAAGALLQPEGEDTDEGEAGEGEAVVKVGAVGQFGAGGR